MKFSTLREAPDAAVDLATSSLRQLSDASLPDVSFSDVSLPDVSLPGGLDVDVAELAGSAVELAGDVAGVVVSKGGRTLAQAIRAARRNPRAAAGVLAVVVVVIALWSAKRNSSDPSLDAIS